MSKKQEIVTSFGDKPPISYIMTDEQYHGEKGISRSDIWRFWKKSPWHFKNRRGATRTKALSFGSLTHCAVLERDQFESRYARTELDRTGTKAWDAEAAIATAAGQELTKAKDYDAALKMSELLHADPKFADLMDGAIIEEACFAVDEETGLLVKCKPDIYNPRLRLGCDLKTSEDVAPEKVRRALGEYGYHCQEPHYEDVMRACGKDIDGFCFAFIEKGEPPLIAIYETEPSAAEEGRAIVRGSLRAIAECVAKDHWPTYTDGEIKPIDLNPWDYRATRKEDHHVAAEADTDAE